MTVKTFAISIAGAIAFVVLFGALRTIFEARPPFIRRLDEETKPAYALLTVVAILSFGLGWLDLNRLHVESIEVAGVRATVGDLQQQVKTLSAQMEEFFGRKRIEMFNRKNWDRVRKVGKTKEGVILEVTLDQEPIPGSLEVFEGVLLMPEQSYRINDRSIQFIANDDTGQDGLTIKYYPRLPKTSPN